MKNIKRSKLKLGKRSWMPASVRLRTALIASFVIVVGAVGIIALRQSFAYTNAFTFYSQRSAAWANSPYPYIPGTRDQSDIKITDSGCGPTSMAMVASTLRRKVNPAQIAAWYGPRFHSSSGTDQAVYPVFAKEFNLKYAALGSFNNTNTRAVVQAVLKSPSTLVIVSVGEGRFTSGRHIMVIRKYDQSRSRYLIADPKRSESHWHNAGDLIKYGNLQNAYSFTK